MPLPKGRRKSSLTEDSLTDDKIESTKQKDEANEENNWSEASVRAEDGGAISSEEPSDFSQEDDEP